MRPVSGQIESGLASSIAIGPTRTGIQPYNGIQGRDLLSTKPPEAVIVEKDSQRVMTGFDRPQRVCTVITDQYRMSLREGEDWNELYDLSCDSGESENLFDSPASQPTKAALIEIMLRRMIELQHRSPLPA